MTRAERIISQVANKRGVLHSVLMSECQSKTTANARAEIADRLNTELKLSISEIGRILGQDRPSGKMHHSSVIAMLRRARRNAAPAAPPCEPGELDSWAI